MHSILPPLTTKYTSVLDHFYNQNDEVDLTIALPLTNFKFFKEISLILPINSKAPPIIFNLGKNLFFQLNYY